MYPQTQMLFYYYSVCTYSMSVSFIFKLNKINNNKMLNNVNNTSIACHVNCTEEYCMAAGLTNQIIFLRGNSPFFSNCFCFGYWLFQLEFNVHHSIAVSTVSCVCFNFYSFSFTSLLLHIYLPGTCQFLLKSGTQ